MEGKGFFVNKGALVDAVIIESASKQRAHKKRKNLQENPSSQIDTYSTAKREKQYFGYKNHIGTDMESGLIKKTALAVIVNLISN